VPRDTREAFRLYRSAAEKGVGEAQFLLALCYDCGRNTAQDFGQALHWSARAAEQGIGRAQLNLGLMYGFGQGTERDLHSAYYWLAIADASGVERAARYLAGIEAQLTPEQLAGARRAFGRHLHQRNGSIPGQPAARR